jgi:hypothetical protein
VLHEIELLVARRRPEIVAHHRPRLAPHLALLGDVRDGVKGTRSFVVPDSVI